MFIRRMNRTLYEVDAAYASAFAAKVDKLLTYF
jgi:hypothetical protein